MLTDLVSRLGNRTGFDHMLRMQPADRKIPERCFQLLAAAWLEPMA